MSTFPNIPFDLPTFCTSYKRLIVEELALNPHPLLSHYGNCIVFGKTAYDIRISCFYLESLTLIGLDKYSKH